MSFLMISGLVLAYLLVLFAWVAFWGHRKGVNGTLRNERNEFTKEEFRAAWGVVWPLFLPAGLVAAPFVLFYHVEKAAERLFHKTETQAKAVERRKVELEEAETGVSVLARPKPQPITRRNDTGWY